MKTPNALNLSQKIRRNPAAWIVFAISASIMPLIILVGGMIENGNPRQVDSVSSPMGTVFGSTLVLVTFFGSSFAPFLSANSLQRKVTWGALAIFVYAVTLLGSLLLANYIFDLPD